jgi:hypothetical protein
MYEVITNRLESKRAELKEEREYFKNMCQNEITTSNFEKNAISVLLVMQQLKSEISELEHIEAMYKMKMQ